MIRVLFLFVLFTLVALLVGFARAGEIIEGDCGDAMLTQGLVNPGAYDTLYTLNVGNLAGTNMIGDMVEAFQLPYLAPGQQVTGATISFYSQANGTAPTANVQLYGLKRVSTNPAPIAADWYNGPNDPNNTLLDATFATASTPTNKAVTYSGGNLATFIQTQYDNPAFSGMGLSQSRYIFFRLSPDGTEYGINNYQFPSSRNSTRSYHPTLALTISNGVSNIAGRFQFSFNLPRNSITSAGVYNSSTGVLMRTLWNNIQYQQGTNYGVWDGNDDNGKPLPTGTSYDIKLIYHNVQYVWQGIVGNTSTSQTGPNTYRAYLFFSDMAVANGTVYYAVGYNENGNPFGKFTVGSPQVPSELNYGYANPFSDTQFVTSDNTRSYWAKSPGGFGATYNYVIGITNSSASFYTFPNGTSIAGTGQYASCIDADPNANSPNPATGLAVQPSGNYLFVAHGSTNEIRVFNKVTGSKIGAFTVTNPGILRVTANGDVWAISGTTIQRWTFNGASATLDKKISGFTAPTGLGVSADDSTVLVADGGSSMQIKAFNNTTGAAVWTYGQAGGMAANGPKITSDAFDFTTRTYIAFQADNTFWIGDQGDSRVLHFSINGNTLAYIEQIAFKSASYQSTVDLTDTTRVFNQFLEYSVNYAVPLGGTNGSWTLMRNWAYGLPSDATHNYFGFNQGWNSVVTLSNGHTYGFLNNFATDGGTTDLFELSANGPARNTGYSFKNFPRLYEDGSLRFNVTSGSTLSFYSQSLTGFDASNNPAWGSPALLATTTLATGNPIPWGAYPMRTELTASGTLLDFDAASADGATYHLGGLPTGGKSWLWLSSPSTTSTYTGWFPQNGAFDIGNSVQYAGDYDMALGRNILYGYHGELWKSGEASQWVNFLDNGLMVGRFGTYGAITSGIAQNAVPGFAGNAIGPTLLHGPDGNTYLYHNDEGNHGGTIRWMISGWDGIAQEAGTATVGLTGALSANTTAPTVNLTSPTAGAVYSNGEEVLLSASVGGNGASISGVQFFDGSTSLGTVTAAPYNFTANLSVGSHSLTAVATDSNNASTTSAAVNITVGPEGSNSPPPAPISLSSSAVTAKSVALDWTEPQMGTTSSTIGQIISFQMDNSGDSHALAPTDVAGAPNYNVADFNLLGHTDITNTLESLVNSSGVRIPNIGVYCGMQDISDGNSTANMTGTTAKLFSNENTTAFSPVTAVQIGNIPYALYDLVVYSLPASLNSRPATATTIVNDNANTTTISQSLSSAPSTYKTLTVAFGSNASGVTANTIVVQGLTSPAIKIQGTNIAAFQIVERPYDQGTPSAYTIQRAPGTSGAFATVGTAEGTASSYTDTNSLSGNTAYQYRLQATNSHGASSYSNTVSVTTTASTTNAPNSFSSWQALYFTPAQLADASISGARANPYGSGVPNLLAYALQLNPTTAQPTDIPQAVLKNGHQEMTYFVPSANADLNYVVEVSLDLVTWNSGDGYTQIVSNVAGANGSTITVQDTLPNPNRFMRLHVSELGENAALRLK